MGTSFRPIPPISSAGSFPHSISTLSFDPVSDILWAGTSFGTVLAFSGSNGIKTVSFIAGQLGVKALVAEECSVKAISVSGEGLGSWGKGGINKWYFRHSSNISTFSCIPNSNEVVVSTSEQELLYLNSLTGHIVRQASTPSLVTHLQYNNSTMLSGSADGYLRIHDSRSGLIKPSENSIKAHSCGILGLQASGNLVFTIGLGQRRSYPVVDPLVKVYDLRTLKSLPPVAFSSCPALIQCFPRRNSTVAIISNEGLINVVDVLNPTVVNEFYQLDLASYITSCAISPTGTYMAFGDSEGTIHLLSQLEDLTGVTFNGFDGHPVEWADTPVSTPSVDWSEAIPLNVVGLPYYNSRLLSAWDPCFGKTNLSHPLPPKVPPQILNSIKTKDSVAYASLPKELKGRRNVASGESHKQTSRFISGKFRTEDKANDLRFHYSNSDLPQIYRRVEIEYSKFGVEDFDFAFYNETEYSGLETHIPNSYTNSLVQTMYHVLPIRSLAKSHITTNCLKESCLLCELGFVTRMLEDALGTNCQASNFCKVAGVLANVSNAIEIIDYETATGALDVGHRIQTFHRFLIEHLQMEGNLFPHNPVLIQYPLTSSRLKFPAAAPITQVLGFGGKCVITCQNCNAAKEKESITHIVDLVYPRKGSLNDSPSPLDISDLFRHSLFRPSSHRAICLDCKQSTSHLSRRSIPSNEFPPILAINTCIYNEEVMSNWIDCRGETVLKSYLRLHGQIDSFVDRSPVEYMLRAVVFRITTETHPSHLVAIIRVAEAEGSTDLKSPWYIFNDFLVQNISEAEALSIPHKWKSPTIIYYERVDLSEIFDSSGLPNDLDETILTRDTSIAVNRDSSSLRHKNLQLDELPFPGMLVAMDAEFVSMQQAETEFRSDGTQRVLRPARKSLARVSVLRGDGAKRGIPFIDDYIHTSEVVVDYLTEFSGIRFGDLDPQLSRHTLTPLKLVYKKLRLLVDCGCIFIGHGLSNDFRIINIYVPPKQVIDTVDLYFSEARQRKLSLRFLSWFVLQEPIQVDSHDSIEDARTALNLYKEYKLLERDGLVDQKLEELYKEGKLHNFRPPRAQGQYYGV